MKKISFWAKNHVWESRLLIILFYILLNCIGIFVGRLLSELDVLLTGSFFTLCTIITLFLWIYYPVKKSTGKVRKLSAYSTRKLFDFSLITVTFLMIIYIGNHWEYLSIKVENANATKIIRTTKDSAFENSILIKSFISSIKNTDVNKLSQREKIRIIKKQVKKIDEQKEMSKEGKIALIALSVIVAIGLLYGVAFLSCSISCGGSQALAIIVAVGGLALVLFLLIKVIKRISKGPSKKKEVNINVAN